MKIDKFVFVLLAFIALAFFLYALDSAIEQNICSLSGKEASCSYP